MKNKEKPKQKEKEFSVSPFKGLKGKGLELREQAAPPEPPKKAAEPEEEQDDEVLFWEAVADVRRLRPATAAPAKSKVPTARVKLDSEDQRVFMQAVEALKLDVRFSDELNREEPAPRPAPVNRLRQVRRGGLRIDLQLDLHGLTRDEAIENLERFVTGAYNRGQKGVLVITGKGMNSPGEPVLGAAVSSWLRDKGKSMVSEFVVAPREMGGGGALVVFLKEKKVPEETEKA